MIFLTKNTETLLFVGHELNLRCVNLKILKVLYQKTFQITELSRSLKTLH